MHDHECRECGDFLTECQDECLEYPEPGEIIQAQSSRYGGPNHPVIVGLCYSCGG